MPNSPEASSVSTSSNTSSDEHRPNISWPVNRPQQPGIWNQRTDETMRSQEALQDPAPEPPPTVQLKELFPGQKRSQAGISMRSFFLGLTFGNCLLLTAYFLLLNPSSPWWRPPSFLTALSLFHFLEFYTHSRWNTPNATISTFLLFDNGIAYQAAHGTAMMETIITSLFYPAWQARWANPILQFIGLALVVMGQLARSAAMATAATNFNHQVQSKHKQGHVLVTSGIYSLLRHPSYFGFFWWAVGTQLVLGNLFSFVIYVLVLWRFFSRRIQVEEKHLVKFFGDDYVRYRKNTQVGIPFIP